MAVKESPKTYEAHGREFKTRKEAERHDQLYTAREAYQDAGKKYQRLLAESVKTADGVQFEFGVFRDYYYVTPYFYKMPEIDKVCYLCDSWAVRGNGEQDVEIRDELQRDGSDKVHRPWVKITDLYYSREAAERALLAAREKWLADAAADVEKLRVRLNPNDAAL